MTVKLTLHIGQHKTGSKALQAYFDHNRLKLLENNIYYPHGAQEAKHIAYRISHFVFYALVRYECLKKLGRFQEANDFFKLHQKILPLISLQEYFSDIFSTAAQLNAKQIFMSCEDLFDMVTAHEIEYDEELLNSAVATIINLCKQFHCELKIVVLLRRPDELVNAHYAQFIKGSDKNYLNFSRYFERMQPRLNAKQILKIWQQRLASETILIFPYESDLRRNIASFFLKSILNINNIQFFESPPTNPEFTNITPSSLYIDLIREMNERRAHGLSFIPRVKILEISQSKPLSRNVQWLEQQQFDLLNNTFLKDFKELFGKNFAHTDFKKHSRLSSQKEYDQAEWDKVKEELLKQTVYPESKSIFNFFYKRLKRFSFKTWGRQ